MQAKRRPPSTLQLCIIGMVVLFALSGAGVLGYTVAAGHAPWITRAALPDPALTTKLFPTSVPTVNFAPVCPTNGTTDANAVVFQWVGSVSYRYDLPNRNLTVSYDAHGSEFAVEGNHLKVYYRAQTTHVQDSLACLVMYAQWEKMAQPQVVNYKDYTHFVEKPQQSIVDFIDINLNKFPLYVQSSGDENAGGVVPSRLPIHLSVRIATTTDKVYQTAPDQAYTFTRE